MHQKDIQDSTVTIDYECRIPFYDVDSMLIAWHGHYVKYFEDARCALLDAIDYNYVAMGESGFAWPIVDLKIKYAKPLHFEQKIIVTATIADIEQGLLVNYIIRDKKTGKRLTRGSTRQVAVSLDTQEMQLCSPQILSEKIANYKRTQTK